MVLFTKISNILLVLLIGTYFEYTKMQFFSGNRDNENVPCCHDDHIWAFRLSKYHTIMVGIKLGQNDNFYRLWANSSNSSKYWKMVNYFLHCQVSKRRGYWDISYFKVLSKCYNLIYNLRTKNELIMRA